MSWQVPPSPWGRIPAPPKPGVVPLRPLSVGDVLGGVVQTLSRYFWPVYAPLLVLGAAAIAALGGLVALAYPDAHRLYRLAQDHVADPHWHPAWHDVSSLVGLLGAGAGLLVLVALLMDLTGTLTGTAVLRHAAVGRRVTARQLLREALGAGWRLLGGMLLLALGFLVWEEPAWPSSWASASVPATRASPRWPPWCGCSRASASATRTCGCPCSTR
ncbi:hypothetical protein ACFQZC_17825 [Streptacidiphilus monticola]